MAVRRIVIHAGHQKTGTTSIQRTLYAGRDRLRRRSVSEGVVYRRGNIFTQEAMRSLAAALDRLARENAELRRQLKGGKKRRFEVL